VSEMSWMDRAACAGRGEVFFDDLSKTKVAAARAICRTCPVIQACRSFAIPREEFGVWGGLTANQRLRIRRGHLDLNSIVI